MGLIYEIICWTTGLRYIGSTTKSLNDRIRDHRRMKKDTTSKFVIIHNNYEIYLLENCDNDNLKYREDYYIRHTDCVNIKGEISDRKKTLEKYNNSKKGKETNKKFRDSEKCKETLKKYKDTETYKTYRNLKIICECGIECLKINLKQHEKSLKHLNFLKKNPYNK